MVGWKYWLLVGMTCVVASGLGAFAGLAPVLFAFAGIAIAIAAASKGRELASDVWSLLGKVFAPTTTEQRIGLVLGSLMFATVGVALGQAPPATLPVFPAPAMPRSGTRAPDPSTAAAPSPWPTTAAVDPPSTPTQVLLNPVGAGVSATDGSPEFLSMTSAQHIAAARTLLAGPECPAAAAVDQAGAHWRALPENERQRGAGGIVYRRYLRCGLEVGEAMIRATLAQQWSSSHRIAGVDRMSATGPGNRRLHCVTAFCSDEFLNAMSSNRAGWRRAGFRQMSCEGNGVFDDRQPLVMDL
jgi:hypothetical protein